MRESLAREEALAYPKMIEMAIRRAVHEAVFTHARLGHPVPTWRDGQVVWLQPAEVLALLARQPADAGGQQR